MVTTVSLDLSVIVLPGDNLRHLHKLILNLEASLASCKNISYELILNKTPAVVKYIEDYPNEAIRLESESNLLASPRGDYVAVFEENSLISPNWLPNGLNALKNNSSATYHTQTTIFTTDKQGNFIWSKQDSTNVDVIASLAIKNQWDFPILLSAEYVSPLIAESLWAFTEESLSLNRPHLTVPESASFIREAPISDSLPGITYSPLYEDTETGPFKSGTNETQETIRPLKVRIPSSATVKETLRRGHVWMKRRNRLYSAVVMPIIQGHDEKSIHKKIPEWAIQAWKSVHEFDRTVFPTRSNLRTLSGYTTLSVDAGNLLLDMLHSVKEKPDYIFLSQHMMKGGGDKVVLNYIKAMQVNDPDWKILLIVTEDFENTWSNLIPNNVDYIDFGALAKRFDITTRYIILMRLIAQLKTKKMMFAMTPFGFEMIEHYQKTLLKQHYQLDAVAFCSDTDKFGRTWGIHFFGIPENFSALNKIATDNQHVIDETIALEPLSRDKFTVHYQPVEYDITSPALRTNQSRPLRVLWASRVANQKRPDVVIKIAKRLDSKKITIDMFGNLEDDYTEKDFANIPSLKYKGSFNGLHSLPIKDYDVLLYTSSFDGVPNILLEATAMGLPIVAPRVGGVDEFIKNEKTGVLIEDIENIDEFCKGLQYLADNPAKASSFVTQAQKLLSSQHSYDGFKKAVKRDLMSL